MDNIETQVNTLDEKELKQLGERLRGVLPTTVVTVTFIKKDGSERIMKCTLDPEKLPVATVTEDKKERKKSEDTLAVYDVEAKGWRSFNLKSIKRIALTI